MKITQDEIVEQQTVLHIELDDNDIDPYLERAYKKVVQRVNIPGFRKGKAPRRIIEQFFGKETLINETLDSMLPEITGNAISENDLDAVSIPSINLESIDPFQFTATVPLRPIVDIGQYKDIRLAREDVSLPEEALNDRIEQLRLSVATWEPVDRSIETGDMVSADINGQIGETDILTEKDAVYLINEEIDRPFPGFSEKLIGLDTDNPTEFKLEIPDDFNDPDIAGQTVNFHVTIKDIKHRVLPELDDQFAQSIGDGHKTLGDLKEEIEKSLKEEAESESNRSYRESLILALIEGSSITLPPLLIEHEANRMMEEQERIVTQANMVFDDYINSIGKTREELNDEFQTTAKDQLIRSFVMSKLSEEESVDISDEDIEKRIDELFANSEEDAPTSSRTDEMKTYIRNSMKVEHTIERLESIAQGEESDEVKKEQNTEKEPKGGDDAPKS